MSKSVKFGLSSFCYMYWLSSLKQKPQWMYKKRMVEMIGILVILSVSKLVHEEDSRWRKHISYIAT